MILSKYVDIKISNNQIKYYNDKGYNVKGGNDIVSIKVSDLSSGSGVIIKCMCEICQKETKISYSRYVENTKKLTTYYSCSRKCSEQKNRNTIFSKYGVDNISKLNDIKNKKIETCLKNFGVEHPQQLKEIHNKGKETKRKLYGDENYVNINKMIETNLKKYGYNFPQLNPIIKEKIFKTSCNYYKKRILNTYDNIINYENNYYEFNCDLGKEHTFKIFYKLLWQRKNSNTTLCTCCNPISKNISGLETQLQNFIKENYNGLVELNKKIILKPYEIDIYLPDLKLAFEFNGVYWHNELNKSNNYHLEKTESCEKQGIHLIHIYEDDWIYKQEIVKSRILNLLGKIPNKIYGRKCIIKKVIDNNLIREFLEKNHLQGFIGSQIKLGLFHNEELVSLMTFGKQRKSMGTKSSENVYEMLRFCNKLNTTVIGGADKLFKYFIKTYNPIKVLSYADRSWSRGELYKKLGFTFVGKTQPNYYYIIDSIKKYRFGFRKDVLIKQGFDSTKTEHDIMLERKIYRIYDSGSLKFWWNNIQINMI